jgi:hypothetical protein
MHEYMHDYGGGVPPAAWQGPINSKNSKNPKTKKGKTAENADRHKIKSRNTNPWSRSPEFRSRCRNHGSRSPEYAYP